MQKITILSSVWQLFLSYGELVEPRGSDGFGQGGHSGQSLVHSFFLSAIFSTLYGDGQPFRSGLKTARWAGAELNRRHTDFQSLTSVISAPSKRGYKGKNGDF
jgi:hypothetical protein